ncbi:DUF4219 domain-containing protein [Cephalotus follicularis]|uniref:DUF4219 domain-containing protein n=1 Tax=Cephalotus follicularis TaxID=3775 RepID=A0A1Q3CL82_CEPFO|nr:DUF4219 domain-containing protein [Cephalotus follicularis]
MSSEGSSNAIAPLVFDGTNYQAWVVRMEAYLDANDLWEATENGYVVPPLPDNPTMAQIKGHKEMRQRKSKEKASLFAAVVRLRCPCKPRGGCRHMYFTYETLLNRTFLDPFVFYCAYSVNIGIWLYVVSQTVSTDQLITMSTEYTYSAMSVKGWISCLRGYENEILTPFWQKFQVIGSLS